MFIVHFFLCVFYSVRFYDSVFFLYSTDCCSNWSIAIKKKHTHHRKVIKENRSSEFENKNLWFLLKHVNQIWKEILFVCGKNRDFFLLFVLFVILSCCFCLIDCVRWMWNTRSKHALKCWQQLSLFRSSMYGKLFKITLNSHKFCTQIIWNLGQRNSGDSNTSSVNEKKKITTTLKQVKGDFFLDFRFTTNFFFKEICNHLKNTCSHWIAVFVHKS